ncbi:D-2-hydroxyacid dehydrogenase [Roseovarius sp. 2305UL8-3]|uniref:D-2-hydroxyacid dehydrogenase n=1 Tax=Roseovarius conchicola TaxID=3121636 RepID=UPI003527AB2A
MTKPARVMILDRDPAPLAARLSEVMPDVSVKGCDSYVAAGTMISEFRPDVLYSITFAGRVGYPSEAVLGPEGPEWIAVGGSGVDHLEVWNPDDVTVTNSAGVAAGMMAEYAFGAALHFTLDIAGLQADQNARRWDSTRSMTPVKGKTMLIVGLGQTGQAVAARAKAFGMQVIGTRSRPVPMDNVDAVHASGDLPDLWEQADVVVLSVPLLDSTRGLVDARAFAAMKESTILVDVSRGGVVDADALINALRNGSIAAAALDVFKTEPLPADSPIWDLENVIISPHCSSVYAEWASESFELFLENLRNWRAGKPLFNIVDPVRRY